VEVKVKLLLQEVKKGLEEVEVKLVLQDVKVKRRKLK